jgi:glycosyltransferase involved in cell wall biosynthesis
MASSSLTARLPRTLHVISGLEVGGAEMALQRLVLRTTAAGQPVMVAAMLGGGRVEDALLEAGVPVASLRRRLPASGPVANGLAALVAQCRRFGPQVVMGWMYHGIALGHLLRVLGRIAAPVAWNVRCTLDDSETLPPSTRLLIRALRRGSPRADAIVYNSELGRSQHAEFGFDDRRARVLPNGVDIAEYRPDPERRRQVRAELGIPESSFVIGHVARFHAMKGQLDVVAAAARAGLPAGSTLLMVGRDVGPGNAPLAAALAALPRDLRAVMPGERRDVAAIMNACDAYCLSSTTEGFPNVVAEALASGLPCVVTDVGDAPRMVEGVGRVVPRGSPAALAEALREVAEQPAERRAEAAGAARRRAVDRYSLERMVDDYAGLLRELVAR